jgi:polysaccharide export outer membrane protein
MKSKIEKNTHRHGIIFSRAPLVAAFISIFLHSCVVQKQVEYLQTSSQSDIEYAEAEFPDYQLRPNDELFIQINSLDEGTANIFSNSLSQTSLGAGSIQPYGASLMSYSIDREGYLVLPVIGNIFVKGKTPNQVSLILRDSLQNILSQPIVSVKLVNRYVSVLGEVRNPGNYVYSQDKLSVFDAIGLAGDITDYGNRETVVLVRKNEGTNNRINIDLTSSNILSSDYYYVRPNDMIYIKPLKNKFWGMRQFPFTVFFSTLTTGLLIYNVIRQ